MGTKEKKTITSTSIRIPIVFFLFILILNYVTDYTGIIIIKTQVSLAWMISISYTNDEIFHGLYVFFFFFDILKIGIFTI